jgi:hypothetical protein
MVRGEKAVYEDRDNPSDQDTTERASFFGSAFGQWFVGTFLVGLWWFAVEYYQQAEKQREDRRRMEQTIEETRKAARRGESGEAVKRLFEDSKERPAKRPKS